MLYKQAGFHYYFFSILGMHVLYSNGTEHKHGQTTDTEHTISLDEDEKIIRVYPRTGWMVDSLSFLTNKGRTFGPYGGPGGAHRMDDAPPLECKGFLAGVKGAVVDSQGTLGITSLSFIWAYCPHLRA